MSVPVKSAFSVEGEGEPLFLIHGIGASRASFAGLVPFLKNDFRVISYDLRGHGASPTPKPPYCLDDLVEHESAECRFRSHQLRVAFRPHSVHHVEADGCGEKLVLCLQITLGFDPVRAARLHEKIIIVKDGHQVVGCRDAGTLVGGWLVHCVLPVFRRCNQS